ncbi:hypothetical protein EVAR_3504_1 [Eumeta japonica]|uniref:Uncharacterized protein n=1 Tax=Eumeta variegata TaxID=151549 RepID=A0A4C1YYY2_EUMVA|nr:hypothetical protein EVAR_3504_1 [Eumeta japonica]
MKPTDYWLGYDGLEHTKNIPMLFVVDAKFPCRDYEELPPRDRRERSSARPTGPGPPPTAARRPARMRQNLAHFRTTIFRRRIRELLSSLLKLKLNPVITLTGPLPRYPTPIREAGAVSVTPLRLRMSTGECDHLLFGGLHARLPLDRL